MGLCSKFPKVYFLDPPRLELLPDGERHILTKDWSIRVGGVLHTVPCGFITDGASQHIFHRYGIGVTESALLHDYVYNTSWYVLSRKDTDIAFTAIQLAGVKLDYIGKVASRLRHIQKTKRKSIARDVVDYIALRSEYKKKSVRALVMYAGVRAFGWMFYEKRTKK